MFRKIIFWSHLSVGIAASLIVLMLAITGVLLTYEVQITRWAEPGATSTGGDRLDVEALATAALTATDGKATGLVFENAPTAAVAATFGRGERVLLDPSTGDVVARGDTPVSAFFDAVTRLHRWLTTGGPNPIGHAATGAANLGFLFLLLTGAYLWLPRILKWGMLKTRILFRRQYPNAKARDFAWHHVFAFWAAIPLIFIIGSGVTMSYDRAERLALRITGIGATADAADATEASQTERAATAAGDAGLDSALATAMSYDDRWRRITLYLPEQPDTPTVHVIVDTGTGHRPSAKTDLYIARTDGSIVETSGFSDKSRAAQGAMFLRFVHTGEFFGIVGQTIAGLASLAAVFMAYTGLALSYRRLFQPLVVRFRRI